MTDVVRTDTHETRFSGRLTPQQVNDTLRALIIDLVGLSPFSLGVSVAIEVEATAEGAAATFEVVQDHDWHKRPGAV